LRLPAAPVGTGLLALLLAALLWWPLVAGFPAGVRSLDEHAGDWIWRLAASSETERRILLIDIDEASLRELGPWPWPRERLARLSDRIAAEGAALQIVDIVLAAPAEGDAQLADRLAENRALLAQVFALQPHTAAASGQPAGALSWPACPGHLAQAQGYLANPSVYAGLPVGHVTPQVEADGRIRRQPAVICHAGRAYPALFVAALARALPGPEPRLAAGEGGLGPAWRLLGPDTDPPGIPLDADGNVRIPWTLAPEAFVSLPARDVLAGRVPAGLLANAWVVVGSSALGLGDRVATPFGPHGAGFTIHAQLLRGALDGRLPVTPAAAGLWAGALALALAGLLAALSRCRRLPAHFLPLAALGLVAALWGLKALLLTEANLWLPWVAPAAFVLIFSVVLSGLVFARARIERERLYRHLASYLPAPVAAALARQDPTDRIDAERRSITALHADIRNFSAYGEHRPPEESAAVLQAFFAAATRIVEAHGGRIEAFQADALLAVFLPGPEGERAAARAAWQAARALLRESAAFLPQEIPPPSPSSSSPLLPGSPATLAPLALGIGIDSGPATIGSFGLARRRTHLALGRVVTAAACLQALTVDLAHPLLLGEGAAALVGPEHLESQGVFLLDGLHTPCHVYADPLRAGEA